jgi:hypothetical protein
MPGGFRGGGSGGSGRDRVGGAMRNRFAGFVPWIIYWSRAPRPGSTPRWVPGGGADPRHSLGRGVGAGNHTNRHPEGGHRRARDAAPATQARCTRARRPRAPGRPRARRDRCDRPTTSGARGDDGQNPRSTRRPPPVCRVARRRSVDIRQAASAPVTPGEATLGQQLALGRALHAVGRRPGFDGERSDSARSVNT